jgi:hypothetical protein
MKGGTAKGRIVREPGAAAVQWAMPYPKPKPPKFKLQVQEDETDPRLWHDVLDPGGRPYVFDKEPEARARLEELFPVLVGLEKYAAGPKRTRVIVIAEDDDGRDR